MTLLTALGAKGLRKDSFFLLKTLTFICINRKKIFSLWQNIFNNGQKGHILYKPYN